jgi:Holliday junction resolvase RusA-like endonuclease
MKTFKLSADIKLISVNAAFVVMRNGMRCRSKAYCEFAKRIKQLMRSRKSEFEAFESGFLVKYHALSLKLIYRSQRFLTKDNRISRNSGDLDNVAKCLLDNVLCGKIDDSYVVKLDMTKEYGEVDGFELEISIIERQ